MESTKYQTLESLNDKKFEIHYIGFILLDLFYWHLNWLVSLFSFNGNGNLEHTKCDWKK